MKEGAMPSELGAWLREQRQVRGWARTEMARQLIQAGKATGDKSLPSLESMCHNLYRWERGEDSPSERYKLYYNRALGIPPSQFGQRPSTPRLAVTSGLPDPWLRDTAAITYRGVVEPLMGDSAVRQEVLMAAHEGSDRAEEYEQHGIGEVTFEQLRADVMRLSRLCDTGPPLTAFLDMRRVRARIYRLLDRRLWPAEQTDLHFLLGCINGLMSVAANRLGYPDAAEELIRAGYASAVVIDHRGLQGTLRGELAYVMYWRGRFREGRDVAADGLRYVAQGPLGADLHLQYAKASARLGDLDAARQGVALANAARDSDYSDDVLDIGGEFAVSRATHHAFAGAALADIEGAERDAAAELERSVNLYDQGPGPGEDHWFAGKALASTDLALVRLRSGALDGASAALTPVLVLPPARRASELTIRLARVRDELAAPVFHGSAQAHDLDGQIEEFSQEAVTTGLHSLSGGPG
jgi:transcriptional regulator with XRE-family HTH domain